MTPYYADDWLTILEGDCRAVLPSLPADSVDCVVTSPPYWGLRDYGTAMWSGGDEACDHSTVGPGRAQRPAGGLTGGKAHVDAGTVKGGDCGRCGASRQDSQLGLERTPEEYVANLVAVFAEVRRVLKPSGTCWLNLGDSYANQGFRSDPANNGGFTGEAQRRNDGYRPSPPKEIPPGLKPKDLVGIPWRVAFALQADGWYLRSDIIWSKPNPMPESVTDRPTKAHEYLFLLTKSARYYFDADAVREAHAYDWTANAAAMHKQNGERRARIDEAAGGITGEGGRDRQYINGPNPNGRNIRSVWTIATRPYPGSHFAVFPPELPERCIKAGSSERGVCPECGAPWERKVEWQAPEPAAWRRTCTCLNTVLIVPPLQPAVILDPFAGSGTVGMVANRLSRRAILIDLNPEYLRQQMERNAQTPLGLGAA